MQESKQDIKSVDWRLSVLTIGLVLIIGCAEPGSRSPSSSLELEPAAEQESLAELGIIQSGVPEPGGQAPDFALLDMDKQLVRLSDFRGTPVVLNFFASWCGPCLLEMPFIQEAHLQAQEAGYVVLGVVVQDSREAVRSLADSMGLTFPMVLDGDNTVGMAFHVVGPPATFFLDENGKVISVVAGPIDEETLERELAKITGA
ncbi:MAG: TlpA disulfide reductase family protein [Acidobacteria bacterium]|nr:TlpA disulfide reductase family protein [Acidobacteriota bacterium]